MISLRWQSDAVLVVLTLGALIGSGCFQKPIPPTEVSRGQPHCRMVASDRVECDKPALTTLFDHQWQWEERYHRKYWIHKGATPRGRLLIEVSGGYVGDTRDSVRDTVAGWGLETAGGSARVAGYVEGYDLTSSLKSSCEETTDFLFSGGYHCDFHPPGMGVDSLYQAFDEGSKTVRVELYRDIPASIEQLAHRIPGFAVTQVRLKIVIPKGTRSASDEVWPAFSNDDVELAVDLGAVPSDSLGGAVARLARLATGEQEKIVAARKAQEAARRTLADLDVSSTGVLRFRGFGADIAADQLSDASLFTKAKDMTALGATGEAGFIRAREVAPTAACVACSHAGVTRILEFEGRVAQLWFLVQGEPTTDQALGEELRKRLAELGVRGDFDATKWVAVEASGERTYLRLYGIESQKLESMQQTARDEIRSRGMQMLAGVAASALGSAVSQMCAGGGCDGPPAVSGTPGQVPARPRANTAGQKRAQPCGYTVTKEVQPSIGQPRAAIIRCSSGISTHVNFDSSGKWFTPGVLSTGYESRDAAAGAACGCR